MNQMVAKAKQSIIEEPTILVVDDKYAKNIQRQQSMINSIAIPGLNTKFVGSCEEAIEAFRQEANIVLCFLDCMLPESKDTTSNYNPDGDGDIRGIEIIDTIVQINREISIAIYSAYVDEPHLRKKASQYKNVVDYFRKEKSIKEFHIFVCNTLEKLGLDIGKLNQTKKNQSKKQSYDYSQLKTETRLLIQERTEQIKDLVRRSTKDIVDIGKYLTDVKQSLQHGQFYPWLQSEFEWSLATALRFMKVYSRFKSVNLMDLNIGPSVLYELSANTVTDAAIEETIKIAESGETITLELAKSIKKEYKNKGKVENACTDSLDEIGVNTSSDIEKASSNSISGSTIDFPSAQNDVLDTEKTTQDGYPQDLTLKRETSPLKQSEKQTNFVQQEIVKIISPQRLWHLGKQQQHTIFCQDPNSTKFIEQLPSSVALCLAFPPSQQWQFEYERCNSMMTFYSEYRDLDEKVLLKSIQHTIEITTEDRDIIAVCYVPSLRILSLINVLGCRAMIADPDRDKCLALVEASKKI